MPRIGNVVASQHYQIANVDCFEFMLKLKPNTVDMVLCDMPYGTTQCAWDTIIDLEKMWWWVTRCAKPNAAIVLTCTQPFTSVLAMSNMKRLRYSWVWKKPPTGHLNATRMPMRNLEDILVFYEEQPVYNPQMKDGPPKETKLRKPGLSDCYGAQREFVSGNPDGKYHPDQLLDVTRDSSDFHPTQKPVALMEYLIKTYTNPWAKVLDFCMGSGTTGVACGRVGRYFLGCDCDQEHGYYAIAEKRIREAYANSLRVKHNLSID